MHIILPCFPPCKKDCFSKIITQKHLANYRMPLTTCASYEAENTLLILTYAYLTNIVNSIIWSKGRSTLQAHCLSAKGKHTVRDFVRIFTLNFRTAFKCRAVCFKNARKFNQRRNGGNYIVSRSSITSKKTLPQAPGYRRIELSLARRLECTGHFTLSTDIWNIVHDNNKERIIVPCH